MKDLSVIICQINAKYIHSSLAAWYLSASAQICKLSTNVIEATVNEKIEAVSERITEASPDIAAFCTYIWNIDTVTKLCYMLKHKCPDIKIILGGPEVSYRAGKALENIPCVDYIISGEGEVAFPKLLSAIADHDLTPNIPGVAYRHGGKICENGLGEIMEIPPSPYTEEYFRSLNSRIAYLETSRGCPYSCAFCLSGKCGKLRFFPLERALNDLVLLAKSGTKTIKLVDRTFNADQTRANLIWKFICENYGKSIPNGVRIHFEIAPGLLDGESLDIISKLPRGSVQFEAGLQSFNKQTLEAINRRGQNEIAYKNLQKLINLGNIHVHTDLIAGLPFEDYPSFAESFNRAFEMRPHMLQLGFLKVLSGSQMNDSDYKYKCKHSSFAPYEVISTDWMKERELMRLHKIEDILERTYNSSRFTKTIEYMLNETSLPPFSFFEKLADNMSYDRDISLDKFTEMFYRTLTSFENTDADKLFDTLLIDRLESIPDSRLPAFFKGDYAKTSEFKKYLTEHTPELFASGVKRSLAVLKSENTGIYADYSKPCDEITRRYAVTKIKYK